MTRSDNAAIAVLQSQMVEVKDLLAQVVNTQVEIKEGQRIGVADRAEMRKILDDMKPHIETIATAKIAGSFAYKTGALIGKVAAVGSPIAAFLHWDQIKFWIFGWRA